jgi:hypothetical protein
MSELCWNECPHCSAHGPHVASLDSYDGLMVAECAECFGQWDLENNETPDLGGSGASGDGVDARTRVESPS